MRMMTLLMAAVFLGVASVAARANLIRNGDFSQWDGSKPLGWSIVETNQSVAAGSADDRAQALKVEVVKDGGKSLGEIRQTIKVKPNSTYRFTGDLKSTKSGQALFMLKPRTKTKELARIVTDLSTEQWATVSKEVKTGEAGELQVLCRYVQKPESVGAISWFTNLQLVRLDESGQPIEEAPEPIAVAKPEASAKPVTPVIAQAGTDQYVTPTGAGDRSGRDWDNARAGGDLQAAIDAAGPGNTVRIGSGTYENLALTIGAGGSGADAVKSIAGHDTGGGLPVFTSAFARDNPEKSGRVLFAINPGVGHVAICDVKVVRHRTAVSAKGPNVGLLIQNVDVTETRDAFVITGNAIAGQEGSGSRDVVVRDCDVRLFTKRGVRITGGVSNVQVVNCHADAGGKEWATEPFAIGFQVIGGKGGVEDRDITFTDCTASNAYHDNGDKYWNADGFCTERAVRNVTWIRCGAFNNTDGGWDLKNANSTLVDCIGVGNKRNFRIWTRSGAERTTFNNCLSAFATDRGNRGHDVGFWFLVGGEASMTRCTAWGDRVALSVEGKEDKAETALVTVDHCLLAPAEGGVSQRVATGTELKESDNIIVKPGDAAVTLKAPRNDWRGGDDAFNVAAGAQDIGYRYKPATAPTN